jgi:hypothetical protein
MPLSATQPDQRTLCAALLAGARDDERDESPAIRDRIPE